VLARLAIDLIDVIGIAGELAVTIGARQRSRRASSKAEDCKGKTQQNKRFHGAPSFIFHYRRASGRVKQCAAGGRGDGHFRNCGRRLMRLWWRLLSRGRFRAGRTLRRASRGHGVAPRGDRVMPSPADDRCQPG
jgi:hypothetical protein